MKIGISTFVNDDSIDTLSLARAIEERGSTRWSSLSTRTSRPAGRRPTRRVASCRRCTTGRSIRSSRWPLLRR